MLSTEQILEFLRQTIAEQQSAGDVAALRETQLTAGVLMNAAHHAGDRETAHVFQGLAASAANAQDAITGE